MKPEHIRHTCTFLLFSAALAGCAGLDGQDGFPGPKGDPGDQGPPGVHGPPGKNDATSGSRLLVRRRIGSDGSSAFEGWLDTTTGQPCTYKNPDKNTPQSTEALRCIPDELTHGNVYSDAACTVPLVVAHSVLPPPPPPAYAWRNEAGKILYLNVGQELANVTAYDFKVMVGCVVFAPVDPASWHYYKTDQIQHDFFVVSSVVTDNPP